MVSFIFASIDESKEVLLTNDQYLEKLSSHEYALKMKSEKPVTKNDFLDFLESCILGWTEKEISKMETVLNMVKEKLINLRIDFSEPILLIKTDGREEWNSAYTRNNSIILPKKRIDSYSNEGMRDLIIHEVFHVISKKYSGLRNMLYGLIGFEKINEIVIPDKFRSIKLTNPDAPNLNYYTSANYNGDKIPVMPLITLKKDRRNVDGHKDIVNSITTKLLVLEKKNGEFQPVYDNNSLLLLEMNEVKGLSNKLGIDTKKFQHPEETIAEEFTKIVTGNRNIASKKILSGLNKLLIGE